MTSRLEWRAVLVVWLFAASVGVGCAGVSGTRMERAYVRPGLSDFPIESVDYIVVADGPAKVASARLNAEDAFPPPKLDGRLVGRGRDLGLERSLAAELRAALKAMGYGSLSEYAIEGSRLRKISASEVAALSVTMPEDATLRSLMSVSTADVVLVVRVVSFDRFWIHEAGGARRRRAAETVDEQGAPPRAVERRGKLILGQAFLYHRASGLRLWSRQLPGFPSHGRIYAGSEFTGYGVILEGPTVLDLDDRAARGFISRALGDFPAPQPRRPGVHDVLPTPADPVTDEAELSFLDAAHYGVEVSLAWSVERIGSRASRDGTSLPELGTSDLAPGGQIRICPRATFIAAGGLALYGGVSLGYAPNKLERVYFEGERARTLSLGASRVFGGEAGLGHAWMLSPTSMLLPTAGLFFDAWRLESQRDALLGSETHLRLGVEGQLGLVHQLGRDGPAFLRGAVGTRVGWDAAGPAFIGAFVSGAIGVFL